MKWADFFTQMLNLPSGQEREILTNHGVFINETLANPADAHNGINQEIESLVDLSQLRLLMRDLDKNTRDALAINPKLVTQISVIAKLCEIYKDRETKILAAHPIEEKQESGIKQFSFLSDYYTHVAFESNTRRKAAEYYKRAGDYSIKEAWILYGEAVTCYLEASHPDLTQAVHCYNRGVATAPPDRNENYYNLHYALGEEYRRENDIEAAIAFYTAELKTHVYDDSLRLDCYEQRARLYQKQYQYDEALQDYTTALAITKESNKAELLKQRADLYVRTGNVQQALRDYVDRYWLKPKRDERYISEEKDMKSNSKLFHMRTIESGIEHSKSAALQVMASLSVYRKSDEILLLTNAIHLDPTFTIAYLHRAVCVLDDDKKAEAIYDLRAVRYHQASVLQHKMYADLKLQELDPEYSVDQTWRSEAFKRLPENKSSVEYQCLTTLRHIHEGNPELADNSRPIVLELESPRVPWYLKNEVKDLPEKIFWCRVNKDLHEGSYDKAIKQLEGYSSTSRTQQELARFKLAVAYIKNGQYESALETYTQLLTFFPKDHKVYYYRAMTYAYLGEYDKALKDAEKAIDLSKKSSDPRTFICRGIIYMLQGKEKKALKDFNDASPDDYWAKVYRGTKEDFVALCEQPGIPGQIKFYAASKLREDKEAFEPHAEAFEGFKQELEAKIKQKINVVENTVLLILSEIQEGKIKEAQARYQTIICDAQLPQVPFYLRRDFLELPLVLEKVLSKEDMRMTNALNTAQHLERNVESFIDNKTKPFSQLTLWRLLSTTVTISNRTHGDEKVHGSDVKKIAKKLDKMTDNKFIRIVPEAAAIIEATEGLKNYLEKSYSSLFKRCEAVAPVPKLFDLAPQSEQESSAKLESK